MIPALIHFITSHIERIIMFSAAGVFIVVGWALYRDIFGKKETSLSDTDEIEDMLKRILNQTTSAIARTEVLGDAASGNSANGTTPAGAGGASAIELSKIKDQLEEKLKLIEELQSEVAKAKSMDASTELLQKIKTLEGKLAEYEIIEDDIADLSHYKDENNRLKRELDALKQGGPALVDAFAATVAEGGASQATASADAPITEVPAPTENLDEKIAAIQANVVEQEKAQKSEPVIQPPVTPSSVEAQTPAPEAAETKADVFAEFSGTATEGADPLAELGDIDTNRMIEELQGLSTEMDASTLEEAPNVDKMAEEAVSLDGAKKA
jgi:hypothetical protein